jgi:2-dehydropantoate 2-reductase
VRRFGRILIMGTGAVGAYFGGKLAAADADVVFAARGPKLDALRAHGLRIDSAGEPLVLDRVRTVADPAEAGPCAIIFVCVKSYDTAAAGDALRPVVRQDSIVVSLQNGIENEAVLAEVLGLPPLLGAVTHIGAELVAPGVVRHDSGGRIVFGELDGRPSARVERLAALFAGAGIAHHVSRSIRVVMWDKLAWNAAFNAVTAITRRTVGALLDDPDGRALVRAAMREVVATAIANGVALDPARVGTEIERSAVELRSLRTSMLQDRERGRRLEHEALNGAVIRAADRTRVAVPVNRVVHAVLAGCDARSLRSPG